MSEQAANCSAELQANPNVAGRRPWHESALIQRAQQILRGRSESQKDMLKLAKLLKNKEKNFGYAHKVLARARSTRVEKDKLRLELRQQHALCTYKDPDLPADSRLDLALEILQECESLSETRDQETLGLAGAIYKRKCPWSGDSSRSKMRCRTWPSPKL